LNRDFVDDAHLAGVSGAGQVLDILAHRRHRASPSC
jgi:hypothetical protein